RAGAMAQPLRPGAVRLLGQGALLLPDPRPGGGEPVRELPLCAVEHGPCRGRHPREPPARAVGGHQPLPLRAAGVRDWRLLCRAVGRLLRALHHLRRPGRVRLRLHRDDAHHDHRRRQGHHRRPGARRRDHCGAARGAALRQGGAPQHFRHPAHPVRAVLPQRPRTNPRDDPAQVELLNVSHLSKSFGGLHAVRDFSLSVRQGEIVSLIGPNGAGKTTIFNLLTGYLKPTADSIRFGEQEVTGLRPFEIARKGMVRSFQITNVFPELTVFENVVAAHYLKARASFWATLFPGPKVRAREREVEASAQRLLEFLQLAPRREIAAVNLAHGELRLLEIAIALASEPTLLLLDEPA